MRHLAFPAPTMTLRGPKRKFYLRRHLRVLEAARAAIQRRKALIRKKERARD